MPRQDPTSNTLIKLYTQKLETFFICNYKGYSSKNSLERTNASNSTTFSSKLLQKPFFLTCVNIKITEKRKVASIKLSFFKTKLFYSKN